MSVSVEREQAASKPKRAWMLPFFLLLLPITFEAIDSGALGSVVAMVATEFQLTATQAGLFSGLGMLFAILATVPVGEFIRRAGFRTSGSTMAGVSAISALVMFVSPVFIGAIIGRVGLSIGNRGCLITSHAGGSTIAPPAMASTAWALINTMFVIGAALGAVVFGGMIGSAYGWRGTMLSVAAISAAIGIIYLLFLRMPAPEMGDAEVYEQPPVAVSQRSVYRIWPVYFLGVAFALTLSGLIVNSTFVGIVVGETWGLDVSFAANALGLGNFASLPFLLAGGLLADRLGRRKPLLIMFALVGAAGPFLQVYSLGMSAGAGGPVLFTTGLVLCYIHGMAGGALFFASAPELVPPGTNLAPVYAIMSAVSYSGFFVEPILAGVIRDASGGFVLVYAFCGAMALAGVALIQSLKIR